MLHTYCRDTYAKYIDDIRPEIQVWSILQFVRRVVFLVVMEFDEHTDAWSVLPMVR